MLSSATQCSKCASPMLLLLSLSHRAASGTSRVAHDELNTYTANDHFHCCRTSVCMCVMSDTCSVASHMTCMPLDGEHIAQSLHCSAVKAAYHMQDPYNPLHGLPTEMLATRAATSNHSTHACQLSHDGAAALPFPKQSLTVNDIASCKQSADVLITKPSFRAWQTSCCDIQQPATPDSLQAALFTHSSKEKSMTGSPTADAAIHPAGLYIHRAFSPS